MKNYALYSLLLLSFCLSNASAKQPNFLFLLSDDQAWNGLSCAMHPEMPDAKNRYVQTPNLEKLASQGMRFSAAYSPASVCAPTRISLQTGKSPARCHWTKAAGSMTAEDGFKLIPPRNRRDIDTDETTIGELLQSAGYATAHYGKWHISGGGPENHGYDESDGDTGNVDAEPHVEPNPVDIFGMGKRARAFMEKNSRAGKPFFIHMWIHALHYPQNATKSLVKKYRELNPKGNEKEIGRAAMAEDLDRGVGELLQKIDQLGIADNTYVIYMSDNGSSTKNLLRGGKGGVWEGGIRVPMIVRGPGVGANSWCHQRIVGYDLYPTYCKLAGVEKTLPADIEGGLIDHLFAGKDQPVQRPRPELVFHFPHYQGDAPHTALFLGDYKLLRFYEDNSLQLYDVSKDVPERNNLIDQKPDLAREMVEKMDTYLEFVDAQMPKPNPEYDPENPPVLKEKRGDKKGGGDKKKKGGGGKKKKKNMEEEEKNTQLPKTETPKPQSPAKPPSPVIPNTIGNGAVDTSPEAFEIAALVRPTRIDSTKPASGSGGDAWIKSHADELDINGDGKLGRTELLNQARMAFGAFDTDGNGVLSTAEYTGRTPKMTVAGFLTSHAKLIDANRDNIITAREYAAALRSAFAKVDSNKDETISADER